MKKIKKIFKWTFIVLVSYFVITTLYFGYSDIDPKKGVHKFYWSGLNAIWKKNKSFGFKTNEIVETKLNGVDGPYIIKDSIFYVTEENMPVALRLDSTDSITVKTSCKELPQFTVKLKDTISVENDMYEMPEKLIAISDIEGNFAGFFSFLLANKVIDNKGNWIFGDGHLVLNGDFVDRGDQVTQVLWLIYSLEAQAESQGGKVHFILGNHEIMNLYGDASYNDFKYLEIARLISRQNDWDIGLRHLFSEYAELGKWLRSKNIVEKIGNAIFVHGGLNTFHVKGKYAISEMNTISRSYLGVLPIKDSIRNERDKPIISSTHSPYWDRTLNLDWKYQIMYKINGIKAEEPDLTTLDDILEFYKSSKIIIGHSVVDDISTGFNNKVIKIDVKHGHDFRSGKTKGLLIQNSNYYKIDDNMMKVKIL